MDYTSKEMLRSTLIPVLLGNGSASHILSLKIYLKSGIVSYVCDGKKCLWDYLDPTARFFSLNTREDDDIICDILDYLSSNRDYLPIIIPCNDIYREFVERHRDFLEERFIIADKCSALNTKPLSVF